MTTQDLKHIDKNVAAKELGRVIAHQKHLLEQAREFAVRAQFVAEPTLPLFREEARTLIATIDQYLVPEIV